MRDFLAIDFETTEYLNGQPNEPWQLGMVWVRDGRITEMRELFFKVAELPPRAGAKARAATQTFLERVPEWFPLLRGQTLVAHNATTEQSVFRRFTPMVRLVYWLDTLQYARKRYPQLKRIKNQFKLENLCTHLGVTDSVADPWPASVAVRTWHDALFDAYACAKLALALGICSY